MRTAVTQKQPDYANRLCQKASRRNALLNSETFDNRNSTGGQTTPKALTYDIDLELGKPVFLLRQCSRPTARKAVGNAGRGNLKKRTPFCNGTDRGEAESVVTANKANASTRKGADFRYRSESVMQTSTYFR